MEKDSRVIMDDKRRIYELQGLVEAQKTRIVKLRKQIEVAHRQRLKKIPTKTILKTLFERIQKKLWRNQSFHHQ